MIKNTKHGKAGNVWKTFTRVLYLFFKIVKNTVIEDARKMNLLQNYEQNYKTIRRQ